MFLRNATGAAILNSHREPRKCGNLFSPPPRCCCADSWRDLSVNDFLNVFLRCDLESVAPLMRALNKMTSVSIAPLTQRRSCDESYDFSLKEKLWEITGSSNGNWANQQKTHRYSSQLQCFLLQRIQRNRALAVRQFDVVKVKKMSRKIKPWIRRYRCVSGLLCRFLRSTLLRIYCEGERGKLR
jgi:hypothetical protein